MKIALPGRLTTAALLLRLFDPGLERLVYLPFDQIMPACQRGDVDAGVIIHESRFTFAEHGLSQVIDLGAWWEEETEAPDSSGRYPCAERPGRRHARTARPVDTIEHRIRIRPS